MEKHSNVNRIFESNKFGSGHQQRQLGLSGQTGNDPFLLNQKNLILVVNLLNLFF